MSLKTIAIALSALSIATVASAVEINVAGTAMGGFNAQSANNVNTLLGLTYNGSTFSQTTAGGFLAFGGNPSPSANVDNFGSFTLVGAVNAYTGNTFTLLLNITDPLGIVGGGAASFQASVMGQVVSNTAGGVNVSFGANASHTYTFANATSVGTFTLNLNSVALTPGQSASVTGYIVSSATAVPEPATLAGLGIASLAFIRRRRNKRSQ